MFHFLIVCCVRATVKKIISNANFVATCISRQNITCQEGNIGHACIMSAKKVENWPNEFEL